MWTILSVIVLGGVVEDWQNSWSSNMRDPRLAMCISQGVKILREDAARREGLPHAEKILKMHALLMKEEIWRLCRTPEINDNKLMQQI